MLQSVRLINYRGLKDTTIPLAPITLLTGTNGIGKTSVLEGLYFLLAQIPDAAVFPRYQASWQFQTGMVVPRGSPNVQLPTFPIKGYDYPSFWEECPTRGASECQVEAPELRLSWKMKITDFAELTPELKNTAAAYGFPSGFGTMYALWEWKKTRITRDGHEATSTSNAAQLLSIEQRFTPRTGESISTACRYIDMSSVRYIPDKLSLQNEKLLTKGLKIINQQVTGVRHDGIIGRLRVIINDESEYSLGTLGVGAEAWTSLLLVLAELVSINASEELPVMFLVDEIGDGIHYSKQEEMWNFLLNFLSGYPQIQMVLTTHSHDCVEAFAKTFQGKEPGMAHIVRMLKFGEKDGVKTTTFAHDTFSNVLDYNWEARG